MRMTRKKPAILKTKQALLEIVISNKKLFNCESGGFIPYYRSGTFYINGIQYRFLWQNYVTNPNVVQFIHIYKYPVRRSETVYPREIKDLLEVAKSLRSKSNEPHQN